MSPNTVTMVIKRDQLPDLGTLEKAITKYGASYGLATINPETDVVIRGEGEFDPETPPSKWAEILMEFLKEHVKQPRVVQFSKENLTAESMQPFNILSNPDSTDEEGNEVEGDPTIVAFLSGSFKAKEKTDSPHSGEFWTYVEDTKPFIMNMLEKMGDDLSYESIEKKIREKSLDLQHKVFVSEDEDNAIIILLGGGQCLPIVDDKNGQGHNEQAYWISSLLDDPPVVKPSVPIVKKVVTLGKPKLIASTEPIKPANDKFSTSPMSPPSWARGSNEITKKWYRIANEEKDSKGEGVVPSEHAKGAPVQVDNRMKQAGVKSMNDLTLFYAKLRATASPTAIDKATSTVAAGKPTASNKPAIPVIPIDRQPVSYIKTMTADEKAAVQKDFVPLVKSGNSPAEIQADEKTLPTFKEVTGLSWDDMRKATHRQLRGLIDNNPAAATLAFFDLLHRPAGTITGTVGEASTPPAPAPIIKKKAGVRLG